MAKRFKNLEAALTYLRPTSGSADGVAPDAPAGTALAQYQLFAANKIDIDYPRSSASLPGEINVITIKPFALPAADTTTLKTSLSNRAQGQFATFGLTDAELGIDLTLNATDKDVTGFIPAKAICRNVTGTTTSTKDSKITGLPYKTKANASYTFPIGRTTTNATWGLQKEFIISQVALATGNKSVTFKPEKY